jgi:hypothetical protein
MSETVATGQILLVAATLLVYRQFGGRTGAERPFDSAKFLERIAKNAGSGAVSVQSLVDRLANPTRGPSFDQADLPRRG